LIIKNQREFYTKIVNKNVPISEEYKFKDEEENIPLIVEKIKDCFKNFEMHYKNFENYRKIIKSEKEKFIKDLKSIFEVKGDWIIWIILKS